MRALARAVASTAQKGLLPVFFPLVSFPILDAGRQCTRRLGQLVPVSQRSAIASGCNQPIQRLTCLAGLKWASVGPDRQAGMGKRRGSPVSKACWQVPSELCFPHPQTCLRRRKLQIVYWRSVLSPLNNNLGWRQQGLAQAAARNEEDANNVKAEKDAREEFQTHCQSAYLGIAKFRITLHRYATFKMKTFNPGREVQKDLVKYMAGMMKSGDCSSDVNPLIVAVDAALIDLESLTKNPAQLGTVQFQTTDVVPFELLAGMHRVLAALEASKVLREQLRKLNSQLDTEVPHGDDSGEEPNVDEEDKPTRTQRQQAMIDAVERQLEGVKEIIEMVELWPIHFYDIGASFYRSVCRI